MLAKTIVLFFLLTPFTPTAKAPPSWWTALEEIGREAELVVPPERWADNFQSEVLWCRRYIDTAINAPKFDSLQQFPTIEVADFALAAWTNYEHRCRAKQIIRLHLEEEYHDAIQQARAFVMAWSLLAEAIVGKFAACRRRALASLLELIGPDAFYNGWMPSPWPPDVD